MQQATIFKTVSKKATDRNNRKQSVVARLLTTYGKYFHATMKMK